MQIKTKFAIHAAVAILLFTIIGVVEYMQIQRERADVIQQNLLVQLGQDVYDLNFITNGYLMSHSARSREQWLLKYKSLSETWAKTQQNIEQESALLNKVDHQFKSTSSIFIKLSNLENETMGNTSGLKKELQERLSANLRISTRSLYGETLQLSKKIASQAQQKTHTKRIWEFMALLLIALMSISMMLVIARSTLPRLRLMQQAFLQLAAGNLDYRLGEKGSDELSSLAKSFNQTVTRLAEITVSRSRLESETEKRKESQGRLEQVEKALGEASDSVFMFYADDMKVFYVNRGAEQALALSREEILNESMRSIFPKISDQIQPASGVAGGEGSWKALELEYLHPYGKIRPMEASLQAIAGDGEVRVDYYILIARDISERKALEFQQQHLQKELEERVKQRTSELELTNKELEAFSYSISHDLRAPLRAINGQAGMLEEELGNDLPEAVSHHLAAIRQNSLQMGHLVDDLLAYSRLSRDATKFEKVDLNNMIANCWQELARSSESRNIDFRIEPLPPCIGDEVMLRQVVFNLLDNALKYTAPQEQVLIEVGSFEHEGETAYFVRDNGVGFDMRYGDKVFEVFHRLHSLEEFEGTGIGLSLVKRIIERHGGRVWAEGEVGKGASFYFTLEPSYPNQR